MRVKDLAYIALLAAVVGVLSLMPPIAVPYSPVPITLQTLGVLLAGGLLGAKRGGLSLLLFLVLVAAGAPLLAGGRGGPSVFVGPSAGYLISWPITAFVIGLIISRFKKAQLWKVLLVNLTVGIFLIYLFGIPVQAAFTNTSVFVTAKLSQVYLPGDIIKAIIASILVNRLLNNAYFAKMIAEEKKQGATFNRAS